jgi:hypothetical protein
VTLVTQKQDPMQCPTCGRRFSREAAFCPFDGVRLGTGALDPLGDPLLGTVVDRRYEVLEVLGEGATGCVIRPSGAPSR